MTTKMAVYYKKYKEIFPETSKVQGSACKMHILLILALLTVYHPSGATHASLTI